MVGLCETVGRAGIRPATTALSGRSGSSGCPSRSVPSRPVLVAARPNDGLETNRRPETDWDGAGRSGTQLLGQSWDRIRHVLRGSFQRTARAYRGSAPTRFRASSVLAAKQQIRGSGIEPDARGTNSWDGHGQSASSKATLPFSGIAGWDCRATRRYTRVFMSSLPPCPEQSLLSTRQRHHPVVGYAADVRDVRQVPYRLAPTGDDRRIVDVDPQGVLDHNALGLCPRSLELWARRRE